MIKLIDLNYHMHGNISEPGKVLELQKASVGFMIFIKNRLEVQLIKHLNYEGVEIVDGVKCNFFKSRNKFWYIPFRTNRYVQKQQPDIVLIQGLIFPLQLIALALILNKKAKIIVQHHGEKPFTGVKKIFQLLAKRFINAYIFTSIENADEWIHNKIIPGREACYEVLEASTYFKKIDQKLAKSSLNLSGNHNFLWVGRLNSAKDPLTVLKAFERYIVNHEAKLFMIYQTNDLLPEIMKLLDKNRTLKNSVALRGSIFHAELEIWYNAADFYISGSHKESTGYAIIEAMACGCIPVVTNIPSFKKVTSNAEYGFLFEPGNGQSLLDVLLKLDNADLEKLSASVVEHFNEALSFKSIADSLYNVCEDLISK